MTDNLDEALRAWQRERYPNMAEANIQEFIRNAKSALANLQAEIITSGEENSGPGLLTSSFE